MNPKLQKLIAQRERHANRITVLQGIIVNLDKKIAEMERLELQSMLRGANMTYQDLTAFIQARAGESAMTEGKQEGTADEED